MRQGPNDKVTQCYLCHRYFDSTGKPECPHCYDKMPKVHWWDGKRVEEMTREELIAAIVELGSENQRLLDWQAKRRRDLSVP